MNDKNNSASHVFHDSIDPESLTALYANDYVWIEEIFGAVLANYDQDSGEIKRSFDSGDLEGLRKSVHKISPAFGFIGMIRMQERRIQDAKENEHYDVSDVILHGAV